jgi:hypothetical protein
MLICSLPQDPRYQPPSSRLAIPQQPFYSSPSRTQAFDIVRANFAHDRQLQEDVVRLVSSCEIQQFSVSANFPTDARLFCGGYRVYNITAGLMHD